MDATNNIAEDLFYKIRSRFSGLKLGSETGQVTINPEEARFFDFDYMEEDTPIGHVSISIAEPNSMKIYFSHGITESMDQGQKKTWYGFLRELRKFAKRRLLNFDTRDIAKDNLDKRDYEFLAKNSKSKMQNTDTTQETVGESIMNESAMYGTKTMSYQKLMDTRLIIKHSQAVMDDTQPGARTRHISALFVENQDGERFKYPFIHLAGARAMQRHVANGGLPYDSLGKNIISMSEQIAQLKSFGSYVVRNDLMNSETNNIVERSAEALNNIRETIQKLSKQSYYENYKANFQEQGPIEVPQEFMNDLTEKFTVKNFKEDIKSVFPFIYKLMQEENTIGYNDIVEMTTDIETNEDCEIDLTPDEIDPFSKFENWVMEVENQSPIDSEDPAEQQLAIKKLQELMQETFTVGINAENALTSLEEIIKDPELLQELKELSRQDPEADARPLVKAWLEMKAPEVLDQIDFGDLDQTQEPAADQTQEPAADQTQEPAAQTQPQMAGLDSEKSSKKINVQELAEFIGSFYDKQSGTFPKGPEGVCVMVGKKFGEQAEHVARKFVERMAPYQEAGAEELAELSRMKELAGMSSNLSVEEDYRQLMTRDDLKILRDAIDDNIIVSVAFVKKDGNVRHMAIKKTLGAYVPSSKEKTDKQANVEQNNDIKKVVDVNAYIKNLKELKGQGMEEDEAKAEAAKSAWRSINLKNVLGFMVKNQFIDLRDENEIQSRFGDEVYNSLTPAMQSKLAQSQQESVDPTMEASDYDYDDDSNSQELDQALAKIKNPLKFDQDDEAIYRLIIGKFNQDDADFDAEYEYQFEMDGLGNIIDADTGIKFNVDELHYDQGTSIGVTSRMINAWLDKQDFDLDDIKSEVIDDLEYRRDPSGYYGVSNRTFFNPRESTELEDIRRLSGISQGIGL
jgi:hypothetical protein